MSISLAGLFQRGGISLPSRFNAELFVFVGQSNMDAPGGDTGLPTDIPTPDSNMKIWIGTSFATYQPGVNSATVTNDWGPEAEFAYTWRVNHPSQVCYLVKHALGGTYLYEHPSAADWNSASTAQHFADVTAKVVAAKAALAAIKKTPLVTVFWQQGESDANLLAAADAYQANLAALVAAVRSQWGTTDTKVVIGKLKTNGTLAYTSTVRSAQVAVVSADKNTRLVDTDNYTLQDDVHFDKASIEQLGRDYYQAYAQ